MGHGKYCPHSVGKLRLAGAFLGLGAILAFFPFLGLAYYPRLPANFPTAACDDSRPEPPGLVIVADEPLYSGDDASCALWYAASEFGNVLLPEQAAPESPRPALSFAFSDPIPGDFRFILMVSAPRSPPISL